MTRLIHGAHDSLLCAISRQLEGVFTAYYCHAYVFIVRAVNDLVMINGTCARAVNDTVMINSMCVSSMYVGDHY